MRKASQDGGDSTSITSGLENEIKKSGPGILKTTKNSIKRKVQNFGNESDDTANEPLLHKNKEIRPSKELTEIERQSAKFLLSKTKTDYSSEKGNDKDKLLADDKIEKPSITDVTGITNAQMSNGLKDKNKVTSQPISTASVHNHMNTNLFPNQDVPKSTVIAKTQILIELDTSKPSGYSPSPLIFTTAKIHTDGKIQQMEPVQVTPVPILSTIESGVVKTETKVTEIENKLQQPKEKAQVVSISKLPEVHDVHALNTSKERFATNSPILIGNKGSISDIKATASQNSSETISSKTSIADDSFKTKYMQPSNLNKATISDKLGTAPIKIQSSQQVVKTSDISKPVNKDFIRTSSNQATSSIDNNLVDINKNFQTRSKQDATRHMEAKTPDHNFVTPQPSTGIRLKGLNPSSCVNEDKTAILTKNDDNKMENSLENKINSSKVKSTDKDQVVNVVKIEKSEIPLKDLPSINETNTLKSPESSISYKDISVTSSSTKPSANKLTSKELTSNIIKNKSSVKSTDTLRTTKETTVKTSEISNPIKDLSHPTTVMSSIQDIGSSMSTLETTKKETKTQIKVSDLNTSSNVSTITVSTPSSTKPEVVSTVCISPQAATSIKYVTTGNKTPAANNIIKTMASTPSKTSVSSSSSSPTITTAEDKISKYKSNNVATVVSSISKANTSGTSSKLPLLSTSSTSSVKSLSTGKQSTSPSTVKTISSIPTATMTTVPHDKKSAKGASIPLNKPMPSSSNNTKPANSTAKNLSTERSTVSSIPSTKIGATASVKSASKSSTQGDVKPSKDIKDIKGSNA